MALPFGFAKQVLCVRCAGAEGVPIVNLKDSRVDNANA
jgi:hypothetical protein